MRRRAAFLAGLLLVLAAPVAWAQKSADTLRITWRDAVLDPDPYHSPQRTALVLAHQVWDGLIWRDPGSFELKPLLAASWKYIDDTTLEFALRPDAKFQNGDPVTAADVVYTVGEALGDPAVAVPSNFGWLAGAEAVDPTHVRIHLKRVFPAALEYIAQVLPILPASYRQRVGAAEFARHPIGSGPYRIVDISPERILLDRFDDYLPNSPKGGARIAHLAIHQVGTPEEELQDLLDGAADWIWAYAPQYSNRILANPSLQVAWAESMRIGYLQLDAAGRSGAGNPLTKPLVRQAIFAAIDRTKLSRGLLELGARLPNVPCFPTQFGCDQSAASRIVYDPVRAKALLAEAGYPNGFSTEIVSYVLPEYAVAVAADLAKIGIDATVAQLPVGAALERAGSGGAPMFMGSWGSYSINDVSAILPYFFDGGDNDYARNPDIAALIEQGGGTTDPDKRRAFYRAAIKQIDEQALWLPLHTYVTTYAFSRTLSFKPDTDEMPRFYQAHWN
jgi:peptide/nickel transport system substrate-binding protein